MVSPANIFVTITIADVVLYWAMILYVQFLPMNFLFFCLFVAECILLQMVPGSSSSFLVLVCVMVPARSLFYYVRIFISFKNLLTKE